MLRIAGFLNFACAASFVIYRDYTDYILKVCWIIESGRFAGGSARGSDDTENDKFAELLFNYRVFGP